VARPLLIRVFVDELPIKILSMVLAVTLFVLVRSDKDASSGAYVKVVYKVPEDRVLVSDPPQEIKVSLRGPWTQLQHIDRALELIHIDLTRVHGDEVRIDEDMLKLPQGVRAASITPSEFRVETEPRVERDVPVQPLLEGETAEGYHVTRVTARPTTVKVDGAKSAVEAIERAPTRPLRVAGANRPVEVEMPLEAPPPHTRFLDATAVRVFVNIQPAIVEKVFDALPVRVLGLNRMEAQVEPPMARLILRGPSVLVSQVAEDAVTLNVEASLIDTRPPSKYIRSVAVSGLPAGVAAEVQPDAVMLTTHRKRE
jgi:YbbR domain-containing protein